ncbi:MAG: hypothetical protein P1P88_21610, partial [Bacteroidales bacterium]|nr:hypothetical protein [Bacteroidales bacterium]
YSLRDSGIIQMLRDGRSPKEVMEAADHSSIEVTNNYVKVARIESNKGIINKMCNHHKYLLMYPVS